MKFHPEMYVAAFELSRGGMSCAGIAKALGVAPKTFQLWCRVKPALGKAVQRGRRGRAPGEEFNFHEYVFEQLSPHLQEVWVEIHRSELETNGTAMVEAMLANQGKRVRQQLFIYALTSSNFNVSQSLRRLNIPRKTYESWVANDTEFAELMSEIQWHKKNFFEAAGMALVARGDVPMTMFALKTQCRDRGWGEKTEIVHSGEVKASAEVTVKIEELDLDIDTRQALLVAMRKRQSIINGQGAVELN